MDAAGEPSADDQESAEHAAGEPSADDQESAEHAAEEPSADGQESAGDMGSIEPEEADGNGRLS